MKCPCCSTTLVRVTYEGMPVFRCEKCHGYVIARRRMDSIQRIRKKTVAQLKEETLGEARPDTTESIRCPRCRIKMKKEFLKEPASFHIDTCKSCELIWFDGGELARLQLSHEITPRGQDAAEMQRRHREMTPQQREQFEQDLAALPQPENPVFAGFKEAVIGAMLGGGRRRRL